ncbi:AMP-binding enzyme [Thermocatellispora tengchongensis]|uniref:AMP-binding enzyme n=1 Tax=Thermocatellispora tengchongensis TaxID=1073253 RepID=UPI00363D0D6B
MPDEQWGEVVAAAVVPRPGARVSAEDLREWVAARLRSSRVPALIDVRDSLPRNEMGKLLRRVLRAHLRPAPGHEPLGSAGADPPSLTAPAHGDAAAGGRPRRPPSDVTPMRRRNATVPLWAQGTGKGAGHDRTTARFPSPPVHLCPRRTCGAGRSGGS